LLIRTGKMGGIQNRWYFLLAITFIVIITYVLSNKSTPKDVVIQDFVRGITKREKNFSDFGNKMNADSLSHLTFYAQYRIKAAEYFYFKIENDSIRGNLNFPTTKMKGDLTNALSLLDISEAWKYSNENFYRIVLKGYEKYVDYNVTILLLAEDKDQFRFSSGSVLNMNDTTGDEEKLFENRSILMVNKKMWIKFSKIK
jgi:hypothetical protein